MSVRAARWSPRATRVGTCTAHAKYTNTVRLESTINTGASPGVRGCYRGLCGARGQRRAPTAHPSSVLRICERATFVVVLHCEPGGIVGSLAVMLTGGGEHVPDLYILRPGAGMFGAVPSNATVSRFFERTVANPDLFAHGFATSTRELRSRVWERPETGTATVPDPLIVDLDATLVTSHRD